MRLFHTSDVVIQQPDLKRGRLNADFGQGFYLTPDYEFARRWASKDAYINEYELDTEGLTVVELVRDRRWFDYIFQNRRTKDTTPADVVIGPIANDTIFDTMGITTSGYLKPEEALQILLLGPEYRQVVIKSEAANQKLHWLSAKQVQVDDATREKRKQEEEAFLEAFGKCMEAFDEA